MANELNVRIVGLEQLEARLSAFPYRIRQQIVRATGKAAELAKQQARANVRELFRNPETMEQAIDAYVEFSGRAGVQARVVADGLPYLKAQEYGVTFEHPGAQWPFKNSTSAAMLFDGADGPVFTRRTRPHEITIPERSFLRTVPDQINQQVREIFEEIVAP